MVIGKESEIGKFLFFLRFLIKCFLNYAISAPETCRLEVHYLLQYIDDETFFFTSSIVFLTFTITKYVLDPDLYLSIRIRIGPFIIQIWISGSGSASLVLDSRSHDESFFKSVITLLICCRIDDLNVTELELPASTVTSPVQVQT